MWSEFEMKEFRLDGRVQRKEEKNVWSCIVNLLQLQKIVKELSTHVYDAWCMIDAIIFMRWCYYVALMIASYTLPCTLNRA